MKILAKTCRGEGETPFFPRDRDLRYESHDVRILILIFLMKFLTSNNLTSFSMDYMITFKEFHSM